VELLLAPGCPNAAATRAVLAGCLRRLGLDIGVQERVGEFPSPTILIDSVDVVTGVTGAPLMQACRLDVPSEVRVAAALGRRSGASSAGGAA
jgi:hypothetical protein